ncbi:MAG: M28 family peptidase, partial [Candidatus Kariarchaeaceae archaeon]
SFSLEEGNPFIQRIAFNKGKELDLLDDQLRPKSLNFLNNRKNVNAKINEVRTQGSENILKDVLDSFENELSPSEKEYFLQTYDAYNQGFQSLIGQLGLMGSAFYVSKAKEDDKKILGVINLETVGFTSKLQNSQTLPTGFDPAMIQKNKTDENLTVGDFVLIISNDISQDLGQSFFEQTKSEGIALPSAWLHLPIDFETIAKTVPDVLRSDHAPFWQENYPALIITDTANFRNPYYHTPADGLETLDFQFIKKVCQTVVACVIDLIA